MHVIYRCRHRVFVRVPALTHGRLHAPCFAHPQFYPRSRSLPTTPRGSHVRISPPSLVGHEAQLGPSPPSAPPSPPPRLHAPIFLVPDGGEPRTSHVSVLQYVCNLLSPSYILLEFTVTISRLVQSTILSGYPNSSRPGALSLTTESGTF